MSLEMNTYDQSQTVMTLGGAAYMGKGEPGNDGFSPVVDVTEIAGGHQINILDSTHTETFSVMNGINGHDGAPGQDGVTPTIGDNGNWYLGDEDTGKPSRGAPGQPGQDGADGTDGEDGFSPAVTISTITGGHQVSITDKTHPSGQSFDVLNGVDGQDGDTPVKGVDYFTPAEIAEIESGAAEAALGEVPSWAKQPTKPSYTATEVGALPDDTAIPTKLSELSGDSTHRTVTDTEKTAWNAKGTYSKPTGGIPSGDMTAAVQASLGKADSAVQADDISDMATQTWVEGKGYLTQHQSLSAYRTSSAQDTIDAQKQSKITASGLLKGNGSGSVSAAVAGTDYQAPISFMTDPNEAVYKIDGKYISAMYDSNGDRLDMGSKLDKTGNGSNVTAAFTQAAARANIATGEKLSVLFGKIAKWYADLKTVAFSGSYNDLSNKPTIPTVPTNVSAFTNDAGYLTQHQSLAAYRTSAAQDTIDNNQNTAINGKENKGKITISGVEKTANTHTVTIVTDGVTSNFTLVGVS